MTPEPVAGSLAPMAETLQKYETEKSKRVREDKLGQYFDPALSKSLRKFASNPWLAQDAAEFGPDRSAKVGDGTHVQVLIIGAGFGGLTFASRFVERGVFTSEDILFVDYAGGFGGTWYWNRYPGLMCDVESASYMPLLEETGYVPKNKYAYGPELRNYAELLAKKYGLATRGLFRATVQNAQWDEAVQEWVTTITRETGSPSQSSTVTIRSNMVVLATGILTRPKLPKLAGLEEFRNPVFHTARWDYESTGGTPTNPDLDKLRGKTVGIVGTGATSIQVVPQLVKWAKELYVFQRTPVGVDERGQSNITAEEWHSKVANKRGWQLERMQNLADHSSNVQAEKNLAQDGWARVPTYCALVGSPKIGEYTRETVSDYVKYMHTLDFPRQQEIRSRTERIVKDKKVAEALKPWYASWCKRPLFSDLYLESYNRSNVHLVNTEGKGIERVTRTGVVACGREYQIDVLIFGTGFNPYTTGSPDQRADMVIKGRHGYKLSQKWENGVGTLHGLFTRDFPNLMMLGVSQTGSSVNFSYPADFLAQHAAYIISEAKKRTNGSDKFTIEPTLAGEEEWTSRVVTHAISIAPVIGCTPSYYDSEGEALSEDPEKSARALLWGKGMNDFAEVATAWRREGNLEGLDIKTN